MSREVNGTLGSTEPRDSQRKTMRQVRMAVRDEIGPNVRRRILPGLEMTISA